MELVQNVDYVKCAICNRVGQQMGAHIIRKHKISISLYKQTYGQEQQIISQKEREKLSAKISGKNNPGFGHGGTLSPFSPKSIKHDKQLRERAWKKAQATKKQNPQNENTHIEYYTSRGMTEEQAILARSERQTTFSLKKCVEKYGEDAGKIKWLERQDKWQASFPKSTFSQISQQLFWSVATHLQTLDTIFFAQLSIDKTPDLSGKNNEKRLKLSDRVVRPDFIDIKQKKVIEFDGTYWHGDVGRGNKTKDQQRDQSFINDGYKVLHISEALFKQNRQEAIDQCLTFLEE